jgi:chaperonin GroES
MPESAKAAASLRRTRASGHKTNFDHAKGEVSMTTTTSIKPLADRVLVRALEESEVKRGGIIIPDTAKEKPQEGEVIAVGPGRLSDKGERVTPEVKKGDRVLFGKYSGTEVTVTGDSLLIMRESDILAVL